LRACAGSGRRRLDVLMARELCLGLGRKHDCRLLFVLDRGWRMQSTTYSAQIRDRFMRPVCLCRAWKSLPTPTDFTGRRCPFDHAGDSTNSRIASIFPRPGVVSPSISVHDPVPAFSRPIARVSCDASPVYARKRQPRCPHQRGEEGGLLVRGERVFTTHQDVDGRHRTIRKGLELKIPH